MEEFVCLNGAYIPRIEAKISIMDYGFLYGYGLFETMRVYNGKVFLLDKHLDRLKESASRLGIPIEPQVLGNHVNETIRINGLKEARVRLAVSIGEGNMVPDIKTFTKPTVLVTASKYTPFSPETYDKGYRVIVSSIRRNSQSPISRMKTANYLENLLSRQESRMAGADDALFLNEKGYLAEASSSNVFLIRKNLLKTPGISSGILNGITRDVIPGLASQLSLKVIETNIRREEISSADEAFLTNSMIEIMPLTGINDIIISSGKPGNITNKLMKKYKDLVLKETSI